MPANIIASITFSSALSAVTRLKVWNTYPTFSARNRSRRASDRAKTSVPPTRMEPADGAVTPAIRLRIVVFPEPLRPRKTVQLPAARARCSRSSTLRARPPWSGNAFFTWCRRTADCSLIAIPRGTSSGSPQPSIGLQDGDRIDRHTDPTLQPERPDDKEKLICPVLGQLVEVEDLDDVGTPVPDEVDVQRQAEKAERLPGVIGFYGKTPFYRGVIGADRDDLHVVQELQAIGADTRLRLMPFGVRSVETPGIVRFRPRLPPPGPNQQNVALSNLDVLCLRSILQVLDRDPIIARQRVTAFVSGGVEQDAAPDHLKNARRVALRGAGRLWRRHVVEESVLAKDVPEGVEMGARMV